MNKTVQRPLVLVLCLCLALSLSACSSAGVSGFDATTYVKGTMDQNYLGLYDDVFLDLTDTTEADGKKSYDENLDLEYTQRFCAYFDIDDSAITPDTADGLRQLLRDVYAKAKYEVAAAEPLPGDEYSVKVTFHPITIFSDFAADELDGLLEEFDKAYASTTEEVIDAMTEKAYRAFHRRYEEDWANSILEALELRLSDVGYKPAVVKLVRVYPDETGERYTISDEDYVMMDDLILAY